MFAVVRAETAVQLFICDFFAGRHFCHPEEAESLACERLPTKDLCICSGNGPPKCHPIALTERLFRTLPQQRHAKVPSGRQQAWPNPNQIRLERKRIENLSYIRPSQNLRHPERCPKRAGAARRVEGPAAVSRIEGRVEIESQWTARKRERLGLTLQLVRRNEHSRPVSPTGDVILNEALFAERRTRARRATPRVFCQQERTFGAYPLAAGHPCR